MSQKIQYACYILVSNYQTIFLTLITSQIRNKPKLWKNHPWQIFGYFSIYDPAQKCLLSIYHVTNTTLHWLQVLVKRAFRDPQHHPLTFLKKSWDFYITGNLWLHNVYVQNISCRLIRLAKISWNLNFVLVHQNEITTHCLWSSVIHIIMHNSRTQNRNQLKFWE